MTRVAHDSELVVQDSRTEIHDKTQEKSSKEYMRKIRDRGHVRMARPEYEEDVAVT